MRLLLKYKWRVLGIVLILALSLVSLSIGVKSISLSDLFSQDDLSIKVMLVGRIPRLVAVLLSGIALSVGGLLMQQLARNKYVSPQTGATIDGAQLGVIIAMVFIPSISLKEKALMAFLFATISTLIFMYIVQKIKFKDIIFVPLVGMMFGGVISSTTQFIAYKYDLVQNASDWLQGDFSLILKGNYETLFLCLPCIIIAYIYAHHFNIVGMGESFAKNLGVNYNVVLYTGLIIVSLLTASVVVTVGTIPFVGLIVPNIISIYKGDQLRTNLIDTSIVGALFLLVCDLFGRLVIFPYEIPIGLTVGIIGSAMFIALILRGKKHA